MVCALGRGFQRRSPKLHPSAFPAPSLLEAPRHPGGHHLPRSTVCVIFFFEHLLGAVSGNSLPESSCSPKNQDRHQLGGFPRVPGSCREKLILPNFRLFDEDTKGLNRWHSHEEEMPEGPRPLWGSRGRRRLEKQFLVNGGCRAQESFLASHRPGELRLHPRAPDWGSSGASQPPPSSGSLTGQKGCCWLGRKFSQPPETPPSPRENQYPPLDLHCGVTGLPLVEKGGHLGLEQEWSGGAGADWVIKAETVTQESFKTRAFSGGSQKALGSLGFPWRLALPALPARGRRGELGGSWGGAPSLRRALTAPSLLQSSRT